MKRSRSWGCIALSGLVPGVVAGLFCVLDPQSAGPATGAPPMDHQKKMRRDSPSARTPALAMPKGWRFVLPPGDPEKGRKAFADLECFKCHVVQGEGFPPPPPGQDGVGPDLSGMGSMHPPEYFAEAIIDPNASAVWRIKHHKEEAKGYLGPDGKTKMPSYNESMTIQQLIDLVAYLKSLTGHVEHKH